jgi:hypothetical protein
MTSPDENPAENITPDPDENKLIYGEDLEVLPNGVINLQQSALDKMFKSQRSITPTQEETEEFEAGIAKFMGMLGIDYPITEDPNPAGEEPSSK